MDIWFAESNNPNDPNDTKLQKYNFIDTQKTILMRVGLCISFLEILDVTVSHPPMRDRM